MEHVLKECFEFSSVCIDDVLIYSANWEEHLTYIELVLQALQKAGLTGKSSKCQWG